MNVRLYHTRFSYAGICSFMQFYATGRETRVNREETAERFRALLKEAATNQTRVCRWVRERTGTHVSQSRFSRALHGKATLTAQEKEALMAALVEQGVLTNRRDAQWVAVAFGIDRQVLDAAFPPPQTVCNLLPPPQTYYHPPQAYDRLRARLLSDPPVDGPAGPRVVALSGVPGSGKTALAWRLAFDEAMWERYDVILYGSLGESGPEKVVNGWLVDLGAAPVNGRVARMILRRHLGERRTLFILDDAVDAGSCRAALPLGVQDAALVIGPATLADELGVVSADRALLGGWDGEAAADYVAVTLGYEITAAQAQTVAELNGAIGGLPQAWMVLIPWLRAEVDWQAVLAAVRVQPEAVLEASEPLRHCFNAAYGRLSEEAQRAVRALGVFAAAPWDVAALAAVLGVPRTRALAAAGELQSAGWINPSPQAADRLEMHRLLCAFATSLAAGDPERQTYQVRHAGEYTSRMEAVRWRQAEGDWVEEVRRVWPDLPQVYQAQAWAAGQSHPLAVQLFLNTRPLLSVMRDAARWDAWGRDALRAARDGGQALSGEDAYALYTQLAWGYGPLEERLAYAEEAYRAATEMLPSWNGAYAQCTRARVLAEAGELARAEGCLIRAWELAQKHKGDVPKLVPYVLREAGWYFTQARNRDGCRVMAALFDVISSEALGGGNKWAYDALVRAEVYMMAGQWSDAERLCRERLAFDEQIGDQVHRAEDRLRLAVCLAHQGRSEAAEALIQQVTDELDALPPGSEKRYHLACGEVWLVLGRPGDALVAYQAAAKLHPAYLPGWWAAEFEARLGVGRAYAALGQTERARVAFEHALAWAQERGQSYWVAEVTQMMRSSVVPEVGEHGSELVKVLAKAVDGGRALP